MSYIGRIRPVETTASVLRSTYTGDGSTTTFNLPNTVSDETQIIATINGVTQQDAAYTTNGSQILFASAPASGDAIELRVLGGVGLGYAPPDGSVVTGKIADQAVTAGKLGTGAAVGNIGSRAILGSQLPAGTVLQVVSVTKTDSYSQSTTSYTNVPGLSISITPTSSTSKFLLITSLCLSGGIAGSHTMFANFARNGTVIGNGAYGTSYPASPSTDFPISHSITYLDSPASTSATTYTVQISCDNTTTVYVNRSSTRAGIGSSTFTVLEIAA